LEAGHVHVNVSHHSAIVHHHQRREETWLQCKCRDTKKLNWQILQPMHASGGERTLSKLSHLLEDKEFHAWIQTHGWISTEVTS
jgi:hypothetical protein